MYIEAHFKWFYKWYTDIEAPCFFSINIYTFPKNTIFSYLIIYFTKSFWLYQIY